MCYNLHFRALDIETVNVSFIKSNICIKSRDFDNKTPMDSEKTTVVSPRAGGTGEFNAGELEMNM